MDRQGELFTVREHYEAQKPAHLMEHKVRLLGRMSLMESHVHIINDVMDGYGYREDTDA